MMKYFDFWIMKVLCDINSPVRRIIINNNHFIAKRNALNTINNILLFVFREYNGTDHIFYFLLDNISVRTFPASSTITNVSSTSFLVEALPSHHVKYS